MKTIRPSIRRGIRPLSKSLGVHFSSLSRERERALTTDLQEQSPAAAQSAPAYAATQRRTINPWMFVPVLYFMQFLPNGLVTSMFGATYKSLGVDGLQITTWTGLAALPRWFRMC